MKNEYNIIQLSSRFVFDGTGMGLIFSAIILQAWVFVFGILLEDIWVWHKHRDIFLFSAYNQAFSNRIRKVIYMDKHLLLETVF